MSDEVIVRMVETDGKPEPDVQVKFAGPVAAAREVNGQELPVGRAQVSRGALIASFRAYQPRTFAVRLGARAGQAGNGPIAAGGAAIRPGRRQQRRHKIRGRIRRKGNAMPAEMLPAN